MAFNDCTESEAKDRGFTRARVLILVPFRSSALRIIDYFELLLAPANKGYKVGKMRADVEFGCENPPGKSKKPADFRAIFEGNCDDHFRMGIKVDKNKMNLYVEFNSADIVIASPLGLKTLIAEGRKGACDFLCSLEMIVIDQADVLYMQNWMHVLDVIKKTNSNVEELHGVDIMRIHEWQLNQLSVHYRQLLIFSAQPFLELSAFFSEFSKNYAGRLAFCIPKNSGILKTTSSLVQHVFQRLKSVPLLESASNRFTFFTEHTLPDLERRGGQFIIYISSYFDYTRVRNYCRKEQTSLCYISEYSSIERVHKSRDMFFNRKVQFLLVTERFHFYHRYKLRGAESVVFYSLPTYPVFYCEFCDMCRPREDGDCKSSVIALFDRFDAMKLSYICGSDMSSQLLKSMDSIFVMETSLT